MPVFDVSIEGVIDSFPKLRDAITEETDGRANSASLSRFIKQAEEEIQIYLAQHPVRPMRARTSLTVNAEYVAAPQDMIKPRYVEVTTGSGNTRVRHIDDLNMSQMQGRPAYSNDPAFFTRDGDDLRFFPVPTQSYDGTLFYYEQLQGLSETSISNWLLASFPHVYLAGALYYAYRDMPDIEKASAMKAIFDERLANLGNAYPEADDEMILSVDPDMLPRRWVGLL